MNPLLLAALLVAGLLTGALTHGRAALLFGSLTLYVFLPALIFEGAWSLDARIMRERWRPIALLAVPGVVITAALVAFGAHAAGLPWRTALLLGAILSATDPVAVVAIFRRLNVPKALATIVESESLLNDAAAVVLYRAVLTAAALWAGLGVLFAIAAGAAAGWIASVVLRRALGVPAQSIATLAGAYAVSAVCDRLGWSGIFGVLTFAIVLRELERDRVSVRVAEGVDKVWSILAVAANAVLFFLLGAAVDFTQMSRSLPIVAATIASVVVARLFLAYGLLQLIKQRVTTAWMTVVRMAGIRGALSVALAIATPAAIAQRAVVVDATFAVAVVTILIGALTYRARLEKMDL